MPPLPPSLPPSLPLSLPKRGTADLQRTVRSTISKTKGKQLDGRGGADDEEVLREGGREGGRKGRRGVMRGDVCMIEENKTKG